MGIFEILHWALPKWFRRRSEPPNPVSVGKIMGNNELNKIVKIIMEDAHAIENWRSISDALDLTSAEFETFARNNPIKDLFKKILERWKSENGVNATKPNLESAFRNESFKCIADKIKEMNESESSVVPLKFLLRQNYEGIIENYVSRPKLENEIIRLLSNPKNRSCPIDFPLVVIYGIGGVGKTTLARRICQFTTDSINIRREFKYFKQNCVWIHAEKEELILKDFSKILEIEENNQHSIKEDLDKFYKNQFNKTPCLIVFDNVDNYETITKYLPLNLQTKVSVLITSNVKCDFGDLGKVENIEIGYFTEAEFLEFVREIIPNIPDNEICFLDEYTGRIPYLANIACRGLAKWRRHHPKENIEKYFEDNDDEILNGGINIGINFLKYKHNQQEIVERQINLMQKHEGKDGKLAFKLLRFLAYYKPDFRKFELLDSKVESDAASISILCEQGFLKNNPSAYKDLSIHRSYQKAVRSILQKNEKEEEQIVYILEISREYYSNDFNWGLLWESGLKYGDSIVEKMVHHDGIKFWFKHFNEDKNSLIHLVEYFKRTKSPKDYIQSVLIKTDDQISPLITCKSFQKVIDNEYISNLTCETNSYIGEHREEAVRNLFCLVAVKKQKWLELFDERLGNVFKYERDPDLLFWAAERNELKAVEYLIGKGFNVHIQNIYSAFRTPLHWAVRHSNLKMAEALLKAGVNPNIREIQGTPLHFAIKLENVEMVKLLLSHNADPNIKDDDGKTALELAKKLQRTSIVAVLEEYNNGLLH